MAHNANQADTQELDGENANEADTQELDCDNELNQMDDDDDDGYDDDYSGVIKELRERNALLKKKITLLNTIKSKALLRISREISDMASLVERKSSDEDFVALGRSPDQYRTAFQQLHSKIIQILEGLCTDTCKILEETCND